MRPGVQIGSSALPSGCFAKADINSGQLFGWESIMTFVLVMTVFAVASESFALNASRPFSLCTKQLNTFNSQTQAT